MGEAMYVGVLFILLTLVVSSIATTHVLAGRKARSRPQATERRSERIGLCASTRAAGCRRRRGGRRGVGRWQLWTWLRCHLEHCFEAKEETAIILGRNLQMELEPSPYDFSWRTSLRNAFQRGRLRLIAPVSRSTHYTYPLMSCFLNLYYLGSPNAFSVCLGTYCTTPSLFDCVFSCFHWYCNRRKLWCRTTCGLSRKTLTMAGSTFATKRFTR